MPQESLPPNEQRGLSIEHVRLSFSIEEDAALLGALTLGDHTPSELWLNTFNEHLAKGCQPVLYNTSLKESRRIYAARSAAVRMVGLPNSAHPLHDAFVQLCEGKQHIPQHLFSTLKALAPIGEPVAILRSNPRLWGLHGKTIESRVEYLVRLANLFKWQGEPEENPSGNLSSGELVYKLARERPEVLFYNKVKIGALARLAAEFGEAKHRLLPINTVGQYVSDKRIEAHIAGITNRPNYEFGMASSGKGPGKVQLAKKIRREIYDSIADPAYVAKVGKPVLWAYFRANPPDQEELRRVPIVRQFLPKGSCRGSGLIEIKILDLYPFVRGSERWLREMRVLPGSSTNEMYEKRLQFLNTLNWHIAMGSYPLGDTAAEEGASPAYPLVVAHRLAFFAMLGWTNPRHSLYKGLEKLRQKRYALVPPRRVVHVLNALSLRRVAPVRPVLESYFGMLECLPESLHKKMDVYEDAGENVNERLQRGATPLRMNIEALRARLGKELERREARIAKGFKPRQLKPGARRRKTNTTDKG